MTAPAAADAPRAGSGAMFDGIAGRYDLLNRVMSLGLDHRWRARLVAAVAPATPRRVLDVATGTGDVLVALERAYPGATVVGLDPSGGMLTSGRDKVSCAVARSAAPPLVQGDGQRLPFADDWFDACTIAFGIRNVPDRDLGLREMVRVTRPGGVIAILELGEPRRGLLAPLARFHVHRVVPAVGALLSGSREYRYLARSIAAFPPPEAFTHHMTAAGLVDVAFEPLTFGAVHLYTGRVPAEER